MKAVLTTKGFEEYLEKLGQAGLNIDEIADEALAAGGQVLFEGMRRRAPVASGHLKRRIEVTEPSGDGHYHWIRVGIFNVDRKREVYFFYREHGSPRAAAHPYIRPTFDEDMRKARLAMRKVFEDRGAL